ncbi:MAG TPA: exodeoxyribonuclease VII small subunit [Acidimicrobiales bacterium]|nr:exodeoxyribonuclease VII small subunit [Acidimicrobiales bacterium]
MTELHPFERTPPDDVESLTYASALNELETILAQLEDDALDVDRLAERVARAATLIRLCRKRIDHTRMQVERIVTDLEGPDPPPDPPG